MTPTVPMTRAIAPDMDSAVVAQIDVRLADIRRSHGVEIPLAIESGSRAWGFPSPDSDYDCRFVFIRPLAQALTPWPRRDVIETPLEGELDVNGWELAKALKLLTKGNAVIIEWLTSPIAYGVDETFRSAFLDLAAEIADRRMIGRHYLHLGATQRDRAAADPENVAIKRMFYALRPAAALRWLRARPNEAVAPMHFPTLMSECEPPPAVATIVAELIARKAVTRELGRAAPAPELMAFLDAEFLAGEEAFGGPRKPTLEDWRREKVEAFYRRMVLERG